MPKLTSPRRTKEQAQLKRLRAAYAKALKKSKDDAIRIMKANVEQQLFDDDLVVTGDLLESIDDSIVQIDAFGFALSIGTIDAAAVFVEEGRGEGKLPVDELVRWMDVRGIDEEFLWPIWNKIRNHGFYSNRKGGKIGDGGKHPFEKAANKSADEINKIVEKNLEEIIDKASSK